MGVFRSVTAKERDRNPPHPPKNARETLMVMPSFVMRFKPVRIWPRAPKLRLPLKRWLSNQPYTPTQHRLSSFAVLTKFNTLRRSWCGGLSFKQLRRDRNPCSVPILYSCSLLARTLPSQGGKVGSIPIRSAL